MRQLAGAEQQAALLQMQQEQRGHKAPSRQAPPAQARKAPSRQAHTHLRDVEHLAVGLQEHAAKVADECPLRYLLQQGQVACSWRHLHDACHGGWSAPIQKPPSTPNASPQGPLSLNNTRLDNHPALQHATALTAVQCN